MKSWILIPSYLWKNTFKRWSEHPISPFSKVLVSLLLSLLAVMVLVFFVESEAQFQKQLKQANSFEVKIIEHIVDDNFGRVNLQKILLEEHMWKSKFGSDVIKVLRKPVYPVRWNNKRPETMIYSVWDEAFVTAQQSDMPIIFFLRKDGVRSSFEQLNLNGTNILAKSIEMPMELRDFFESPYVVALPEDMALEMSMRGMVINTTARFQDIDQVREFLKYTQAYYKAEKRRVRTFSSLTILESLEKIQKLRKYVRLGVVIFCGAILAIILGAIAWLEFLHESYIMALIRSFGVPRIVLFFHTLLENIILSLSGMALALFAWPSLYNMLSSRFFGLKLRDASEQVLPVHDLSILFIAAIVGVFIAMIPVGLGLRKETGNILS